MNNIDIVPMRQCHIDGIAELEKQCFSQPWSREALAQELSVECAVFYAALINDAVVGYVGMHNICNEGYITNIAVDAEHRRNGIAKALINKLFEYAKINQLEFISLEVRVSNDAAIRLYEKTGFKAVGVRKRFYSNPTEDAVIMTAYFDGDKI